MRQIVIWGTGKNAVNFKLLNTDISIVAFIDSYRKETDIVWNNIPILLPDEAKSLIRNNYTVVATSESVYFDIKRVLEEYGLREFKDFCFYTCFEKKIAVIYGNCHTLPIKQGLCASRKINAEYGFYPLPQIQNIKRLKDKIPKELLDNCALFIHQSIRKENRYGVEYSSEQIISMLNKECNVISIPNLYGLPTCLYPHHNFFKGGSGKRIRGISYFPYRDSFIENEYKNGKSVKEIAKEIYKKDILPEGYIRAEFEKFINKVGSREVEWDIKIKDWIVDNIQHKQLFYDANHPTEHVMKYITNKMYEFLEIPKTNVLDDVECILDDNELPLYGQVIRELGLEYSNRIMRRHNSETLTGFPITVEEYVDQYIRWNISKDLG